MRRRTTLAPFPPSHPGAASPPPLSTRRTRTAVEERVVVLPHRPRRQVRALRFPLLRLLPRSPAWEELLPIEDGTAALCCWIVKQRMTRHRTPDAIAGVDEAEEEEEVAVQARRRKEEEEDSALENCRL